MNDETTQPNTYVSSGPAAETADAPDNSVAAELETLRRENEELKTATRLRDARESLAAELERAGARSPELMFAAVMGELEFDDQGKVQNSAALISLLRRSYPEQFDDQVRTGSIDAGAGRGTRMLTAGALARMTPAEIARLDWAEVRETLRSGK